MTEGQPDAEKAPIIVRHAQERMLEMNVSMEAVLEVLLRPKITWYSFAREAWTYQGTAIALGVKMDRATGAPVVLTVLWRDDEDWTSRYPDGRR